MLFRDLVLYAVSALMQQKIRTILTIIGVIVGTFTLVVSLSVGRGVDRAILALFRDADTLRKIEVRTRFETRPEDVPEAERTRVFERFSRGSTASHSGSGLGLALVAQQAELHNGTATLETSPLGGARLVLRLAGHPG